MEQRTFTRGSARLVNRILSSAHRKCKHTPVFPKIVKPESGIQVVGRLLKDVFFSEPKLVSSPTPVFFVKRYKVRRFCNSYYSDSLYLPFSRRVTWFLRPSYPCTLSLTDNKKRCKGNCSLQVGVLCN